MPSARQRADAPRPGSAGGLGWLRRLGLGAAALAAFLLFLILGFPADRVAPRLRAEIEAATGARASLGAVALGVGWAGPHATVSQLDLAWPSGRSLHVAEGRVRPAWSADWLRGRPALVVALRSPLGALDGTVRPGEPASFSGELRDIGLERLPREWLGSAELTGLLDLELDLTLAPEGPSGTARFRARNGSIAMLELPVGLPFRRLGGVVELGGAQLALLQSVVLEGPLLIARVSGSLGHGGSFRYAPLHLDLEIVALEGAVRDLLRQQGLPVGPDGTARFAVGGTPSAPRLEPRAPGSRPAAPELGKPGPA